MLALDCMVQPGCSERQVAHLVMQVHLNVEFAQSDDQRTTVSPPKLIKRDEQHIHHGATSVLS